MVEGNSQVEPSVFDSTESQTSDAKSVVFLYRQ